MLLQTQSIEAREEARKAYTIELSINEYLELEKGKGKNNSAT